MLGTVPEFIRGDKGDLNNSKPFQRFCTNLWCWAKCNVPNDSMFVGHGKGLCPTYAVGNTNSLIFASAGMTRLPSRYEAPPRNVACEALPQNNALQNVQRSHADFIPRQSHGTRLKKFRNRKSVINGGGSR